MEMTLTRYPKVISGSLTARPMEASDARELLSFFKRIPVDERQLFKDDVTQPSVLQGWIRNLGPQKILHLLALDGPRIVADATLHRDWRGWAHHVAEIRVTLDPDYR